MICIELKANHDLLQVETGIQNEVFEQLQQVRNDLERSRKEASEGRQKAERELFEASMKVWHFCYHHTFFHFSIILP